MKSVNKCIATYWTDGQPSRGMRGENKGRHTAIAYSENKVMRVSLPARLNNYKMPTVRDMAAIMRGDSVAVACAEFNAQATAPRGVNLATEHEIIASTVAAVPGDSVGAALSIIDGRYIMWTDLRKHELLISETGPARLLEHWRGFLSNCAAAVPGARVNLVKRAATMDEQTDSAIAATSVHAATAFNVAQIAAAADKLNAECLDWIACPGSDDFILVAFPSGVFLISADLDGYATPEEARKQGRVADCWMY
jgi:hypothetical protein